MWLESLRKMKQKSGLTTAEIASGSGIPEPTLEKLFAGATKEPKLPTMKRLVYFLGYTLEDLYKEDASVPSDEGTEALGVDEVVSAFVAAGLVPAGRDLSDADVRFIMTLISATETWFAE